MTREEAKAFLTDISYDLGTMGMEYLSVKDGEKMRDAIETLEQEPKTGHWIKSNIGGAKVCSVCNAHMGLSSFKFCPSCGAKMVEPQESEKE